MYSVIIFGKDCPDVKGFSCGERRQKIIIVILHPWDVLFPWVLFVLFGRGFVEETRVALIAIIVENFESVEKLNMLLHEYAPYVIGRMGVPYQKKNISVISVAVDAPSSTVSALTGKIGMLDGISCKTVFSKK